MACLTHPLPIAKGILGDRGLREDLHSEPISPSVIGQWGPQTSIPLRIPSTTQCPASFSLLLPGVGSSPVSTLHQLSGHGVLSDHVPI